MEPALEPIDIIGNCHGCGTDIAAGREGAWVRVDDDDDILTAPLCRACTRELKQEMEAGV